MLPMEIIHKIDAILARFLWYVKELSCKIHLARLSLLAKVVDQGRWGILDALSFNRALICKSLWRGLSCRGIWSQIIRGKYLDYQDYEVCIKGGAKIPLSSSYILHNMMRQRHWLVVGLCWEVGWIEHCQRFPRGAYVICHAPSTLAQQRYFSFIPYCFFSSSFSLFTNLALGRRHWFVWSFGYRVESLY